MQPNYKFWRYPNFYLLPHKFLLFLQTVYFINLHLHIMDYSKDTIKCPWKLGEKIENSPHIHEPFRAQQKKIYDDVLDAIGNTPLIKINKLGPKQGINC